MALHADAGKRHAGVAQLADVLHVVVEPVAGGDVVIVDEELGVGVALLHPERHLPDEIDAEALLVVVGVHHFVVEVVLGEPAAIARADGAPALGDGGFKIVVVHLLQPRLDMVRHTPENTVAAQRNAFLFGPGEHVVHHAVIHLAFLPFHDVPLEIGFGNAGVEVADEDLLPFGDVFRGGAPREGAAGQRGAEPELMAHLFHADFGTGGGKDHQRSHAVFGDGGIQAGVRRAHAGRAQKEEGENGFSNSHGGKSSTLRGWAVIVLPPWSGLVGCHVGVLADVWSFYISWRKPDATEQYS